MEARRAAVFKSKNINLRKQNKKNQLLNILRHTDQMSKSELKAASMLSMATVIQCIEELEHDGLVMQVGVGDSTGGRPPVWYAVNPKGAYFIGIEFSGDSLSCCVLNLQAREEYSRQYSFNEQQGAQMVMDTIIGAIHEAIQTVGCAKEKIQGIGVGAPGDVDTAQGVCLQYGYIEAWQNIEIADILRREFGVEVFVEENINAMALAYRWYEADEEDRDILLIAIRSGVGMGCVLGGKLYTGSHGKSGEIGHIRVSENNKRCYCGRYGCLETEVGSRAIVDKMNERLREGGFPYLQDKHLRQAALDDFMEAVQANDPDAVAILSAACRYLGRAICDVVTLFDPKLCVYAGQLTKLPLFDTMLQLEINQNLTHNRAPDLRIQRSRYGDKIGCIGAACVVMERKLQYTAEPI